MHFTAVQQESTTIVHTQAHSVCACIYFIYFLLLCHALACPAHKGLHDTIINTQTDQKPKIDAK